MVAVQQSNKVFKIPTTIDVYSRGGSKKSYKVWLQNKADTFYFASATKPSFINVDADKVLLCTKTDNKTAEEFEQQYQFAGKYLDRREALDYFAKNKLSQLALGLSDKYSGLRLFTLEKYEQSKGYTVPSVLAVVEQIAAKDPNKKVQAKALEILAKVNDKKYEPLFTKFINDSSYSVAGAALEGLVKLEPAEAYDLAKKYSVDARGNLGNVVAKVIMANATEADFDFLLNQFKNAPFTETKMQSAMMFGGYLTKVKDAAQVKKGVDEIMKLRNQIPQQYHQYIDPAFKQVFNKISATQKAAGNDEVAGYIEGLLK
jgi:aminopeptidase N